VRSSAGESNPKGIKKTSQIHSLHPEELSELRHKQRRSRQAHLDVGQRTRRDGCQSGQGRSRAVIWGDTAANIGETKLPIWATQFQFERSLLPSLYDLLDALGSV
jgi:hypothetical protein